MSDCCDRSKEKHGALCATWWEQAYSSEYRKFAAQSAELARLRGVMQTLSHRLMAAMRVGCLCEGGNQPKHLESTVELAEEFFRAVFDREKASLPEPAAKPCCLCPDKHYPECPRAVKLEPLLTCPHCDWSPSEIECVSCGERYDVPAKPTAESVREAVIEAARKIRCLCRSADDKERHYASCEMPALKTALAALDAAEKPAKEKS